MVLPLGWVSRDRDALPAESGRTVSSLEQRDHEFIGRGFTEVPLL